MKSVGVPTYTHIQKPFFFVIENPFFLVFFCPAGGLFVRWAFL